MGTLRALLDEAREGRGACVTLSGAPGVGRTRLLDEIAATVSGVTVLRARGDRSETGLPFAGLSLLLAPVIGLVRALPREQAAVLRAALSLGARTHGDRFAVGAATLGVVRAAARARPVLILLDDVDRLEGASREALNFAGRRIDTDPILMIAAAESGRGAHRAMAATRRLEVRGLDPAASAAVLAATTSSPVPDHVAMRLHVETGGNALALGELARELLPAQIEGHEPLPDPLPLGREVADRLGRAADLLPAETARMLLLAAAAGPAGAFVLAGAAGVAGLAVEDLEPAERAGLIRLGETGPVFAPPVARSAVYLRAPDHERRAAHRAIALALSGADAPELRAWHLAAAALAPDETAAEALDVAAAAARARGAHAVAAATFERAAGLSPHTGRRAERLLSAAAEWLRAGAAERAAGLADGAAAHAVGRDVRTAARRLRAGVATLQGGARLAAEILLAEGGAPGQSPDAAASLLAAAVTPLAIQGDVRAALGTARRAVDVAAEALSADVRACSRAALGAIQILSGSGREGRPLLEDRLAAVEALGGADGEAVDVLVLHALLWAGETERADALVSTRVTALRGAGAVGGLPPLLALRLDLDRRLGRWDGLEERCAALLAAGRDQGMERVLHTALRETAWVAAAQGREGACRANVEEMTRLTSGSDVSSRLGAAAVLGFLELGLGRPDVAASHLEEAAWLARGRHGVREPNVIRWAPDLVEAYARAGRLETAERELALLAADARGSPALWTRGVVARCSGMLAPAAEAETWFAEALDNFDRAVEPFERARTELLLGERRRRMRRRAQAREPLDTARSGFERLAAEPWARRARAELAAAGAPPDPAEPARAPGAVVDMTAQERRLAELVATGATNREVAASVHLSLKTVEEHLSRLYRKLGVRSRTELVRVVIDGVRPDGSGRV
jgi:DNA-binding CsgD family transcriptional regulator/tetratricopeptide (TPR) repeat protein